MAKRPAWVGLDVEEETKDGGRGSRVIALSLAHRMEVTSRAAQEGGRRAVKLHIAKLCWLGAAFRPRQSTRRSKRTIDSIKGSDKENDRTKGKASR